MPSLDPSYLTPTCVNKYGMFEVPCGKDKCRLDQPISHFVVFNPSGQLIRGYDWLWTDRIPRGRVTVIEGPSGAGKSFLTADLAARVTTGQPWGDGPEGPNLAGEVIYVCSQHEADDAISPRLMACGADPFRVIYQSEVDCSTSHSEPLGTRRMQFPQDLNMIEKLLKECPETRLVVIDPLRDYCPTPRLMREALSLLEALASKYKVAIVVTIQAEIKFTKEGEMRHTPRTWDEAARYVWCVTRDPCDPGLMRFEPKRTSFCKEPKGVAFRVNQAGGVVWEPLLPRRTKFAQCQAWLTERMSQGAVWSSHVQKDAKEFGFSESMLHRAREELGIRSDRQGGLGGTGSWWWTFDGSRPTQPEFDEPARPQPRNRIQGDPIAPAAAGADDLDARIRAIFRDDEKFVALMSQALREESLAQARLAHPRTLARSATSRATPKNGTGNGNGKPHHSNGQHNGNGSPHAEPCRNGNGHPVAELDPELDDELDEEVEEELEEELEDEREADGADEKNSTSEFLDEFPEKTPDEKPNDQGGTDQGGTP